jgi:signal transduction histidine kinase
MAVQRSGAPPPPDFRALFESAPGLYLVLTTDLTIVAVSDAYLRATMTRREDIIGRGIFDVFPDNPDDPAATGVATLRASLKRVCTERRPDAMAVQKYDIRRPDSEGGGFEERHWSPVNSPVFDTAGEIAYIIHRVEDVTEFVRLKQRGTEQQEVARALKTRAGAMEVEIYRRAQEIQEANRQLRELQGELEARVEARTAALRQANEELQREIGERVRTEEALRRSEDQLRQSQKLEAVGRLAGGVAHDFNNLLTVILSYTDMIARELEQGHPVRAQVEEIDRAGMRAADLTRQLLAFSRQQVLDPQILDLNEVLVGVSKMLIRVLGEDIEMKMALAPTLGPVRADRGQIEQIMMNLVVNARDAMPRGGKLTLETADIELDSTYAGGHLDVKPGPYVMLAVSDTGIGMDPETQARVFEPFFTTKPRGQGTGLGLSTVFGIVKQSGGNIWLYSEPGAGAIFRIYLPRVEGQVDAARPAITTTATGGTETILLVEDHEQVRAVAGDALRKAGYRVLVTGGPEEGLRVAREHPGPIDLLLTDVVMPGMNGRAVADRVLALRAGIRVLFMSGYTDDVILHHGVFDRGVAFIQKPLTPLALTRKVREVLDAADADDAGEARAA